MREGAAECLRWQSPEQDPSISNTGGLEYDRSSESARLAANVYEKSRLRLVLQNPIVTGILIVDFRCSDALPGCTFLAFRTELRPEFLAFSKTGDYTLALAKKLHVLFGGTFRLMQCG